MKRVAVYCGSHTGADPAFARDAAALGTALAERGIGVVYGGGRVGLMGVVADTVLAAGGEVIGVMPTHLVRREIAHSGLTELVEVGTMHERKAIMIDRADGFIALPGGVGTLEELSEVLSWARIGLLDRPVGLVDTAEFYQPLLRFFDAMVANGFISSEERGLVMSDPDAGRLVRRIADGAIGGLAGR